MGVYASGNGENDVEEKKGINRHDLPVLILFSFLYSSSGSCGVGFLVVGLAGRL